MIIFFTASLTGKKQYIDNYKRIVDVLNKSSHKIIYEHIFSKERKDIEKETIKERRDYHKKVNQWISKSDFVVAEISYPSIGVGFQITKALEIGKPVIALHVEEKIPIALIGEISEKLILAPYSLENISRTLSELIEEAREQMDVRFNFFIQPKIGAYLDWIARKRKIPRAVFLRRLIEESMAKDKEYKA